MRTTTVLSFICILITSFSFCFTDQSYNAPLYFEMHPAEQYNLPSTWQSIQNIADHVQVNMYESDQWNRPYYQDPTYENVDQSSSSQKQSETLTLLRPVK